ncbi:hypothetical protein SDC9_199722 [bioreactor metagenome]|uniref:Uncharacterized protein n=1 Tax=bioreactor metagenome TaxID=1076179 RepID=A0A645IL93_9ZZZZ
MDGGAGGDVSGLADFPDGGSIAIIFNILLDEE